MSSEDLERSSLDWPRQVGRTDLFLQTLAERTRYRRRRRFRLAGLAGFAVLFCCAALYSLRLRPPAQSAAGASASVLVTTPRQEVLPDGSVVQLRDGAEIAIAFTPEFRRVALRRGEAHFQVAKNKARPFIVEAGRIEVRAVGTEFSVELGSKTVEVLVNEGKVAVASVAPAPPSPQGPLPAPVYLDAGHRVVVDLVFATPTAPSIEPISPKNMADLLAWRVPHLQLRGTPLSEAIAQVNRYAHARLILADPRLGTIELSGILRADNVDALLQLLDTNYGIKTKTNSDGGIILRKAP